MNEFRPTELLKQFWSHSDKNFIPQLLTDSDFQNLYVMSYWKATYDNKGITAPFIIPLHASID